MKVTGLDLSMTATGVCHTQVDGSACWHVIKSSQTGDHRLNDIAGQVVKYAEDSDLVLIEGYLNRSMSAGITGMVHGAVRVALIEQGLRYATLPPTSLKKYATGKGGASKTEMALAALKRSGHEFTDDNQCDAWWLWVAANDYLGQSVMSLPKGQRDCLAKLKMEV